MQLELIISDLFAALVSAPSSSTHARQVRVFEKLSLLSVDALSDLTSPQRMEVERVLREIVFGEFGSQASTLTLPLCGLLCDAWARLYLNGDTKNTLTLAGEFQDACKPKAPHSPQVQAAALYSFIGICKSRGKALAGHLPDTIQLASAALQPRNNQAFRLITVATLGAVQAPTTAAPSLRVAAVEALTENLRGAGEAGRREWPNALKVLVRAATVKSSASVRLAGLAGLKALACMPAPMDKLMPALLPSLSDSELDVRLAGAEAVGSALGMHSPPTLPPGDKPPALESIHFGSCPLPDVLESIRAACLASPSLELKQTLGRVMVVTLRAAPPPDSADALTAALDSVLGLANVAEDGSKAALEHALVAAYVLRAALGSRLPERLQLVAVKHLTSLQHTAPRASTRRAALMELQSLVLTLGQGSNSQRQDLVKTLFARLLVEDDLTALFVASAMRAVALAIPESVSEQTMLVLEHLAAHQAAPDKVSRPVLGLCALVRAAAAMNRGGAIDVSSLFGMAKALASRQLDSDPSLLFTSAGWDLVAALVSLGPSFWGPHLTQLFALWQEALAGPHTVSVAAVTALATLLRCADSSDEAVLGRAAAVLLNRVMSPAVSRVDTPEHARLHAALLEAASRSMTAIKSEEHTLMPLALTYLEGALGARTSLLGQGGLLIPANDVLDFAPPVEDLAWEALLRADLGGATAASHYKDALEACMDLHALVGRRARSRPNLGQRLGQAGHLSEAPLPPAEATCVAPGIGPVQRAADAACAFCASAFARADDAGRTRLLSALLAKLGFLPGGAALKQPPHNAALAGFNVQAALLSGLRMVQREPPGDALWHSNASQIVLLGLSAACPPPVRRAAAQSLAALARLAPALPLCATLEALMSKKDEDCSACLLASARLRREELKAPRESVVYEACKQTTQPVRVWALHAWHLIVQGASVADASRFVKPTLALIMAHLLADCPPAVEGERQHNATLYTLGRLVCTVTQSLGPELASDDEACSKLVAAWRVLLKWRSIEVQRQCVKFVELVALFHPHKFSQDVQFKRDALKLTFEHLQGAHPLLIPNTVTCALRLAERDVEGLASSQDLRKSLFAALERASRAGPSAALCALQPLTSTWDLRGAWSLAEMQGAAGPPRVVSPERYALYYPPELEEQVCHILVEMIRSNPKVLGEWFSLCAAVIAGGHEEYGEQLKEPRWQTRTVAVECLSAVVRAASLMGEEHMDLKRARTAASNEEPLVQRLEALLSCAAQAATASVGESGVATLQARGLACLARIVTIFGRQASAPPPGD